MCALLSLEVRYKRPKKKEITFSQTLESRSLMEKAPEKKNFHV
jgi:hypothetical protein